MSIAALDGLLDPLTSALDPSALRQIVEFRISPEVEARVDYLAKRANDGELTLEEDAEYEALIDGADWITILKLKARGLLAARGPSPVARTCAGEREIAVSTAGFSRNTANLLTT